jgi:hypothetical protein
MWFLPIRERQSNFFIVDTLALQQTERSVMVRIWGPSNCGELFLGGISLVTKFRGCLLSIWSITLFSQVQIWVSGLDGTMGCEELILLAIQRHAKHDDVAYR